jgi:hypothetical protein
MKLAYILIPLIIIPTGCLTPVSKEAISLRNEIAEQAFLDSQDLSAEVEAQLLELFTMKAEQAYGNLQSQTEIALAGSTSTEQTVAIMNSFYRRREVLTNALRKEAEAHATYVAGINTLGYGIKAINAAANEEARVANEPLIELAIAGFRSELSTLLAQLEEQYMPKAPTPTPEVTPEVEEPVQ